MTRLWRRDVVTAKMSDATSDEITTAEAKMAVDPSAPHQGLPMRKHSTIAIEAAAKVMPHPRPKIVVRMKG